MKGIFCGFNCILAASLIFSTACRHYSIEMPGEPQPIAIAPIVDDTDLPQLIAPLSRNLREAIANDPNWKLTDANRSPQVLTVRLVPAKREVISRNPTDTGRPLSIREQIIAELSWEGQPNDTEPQRVSVQGILYSQPGLLPSQDGLIAELADRLAMEILRVLNTPASAKEARN